MSDFQLKPLFDNVIIEPIEDENKTASGVILPDSAKQKPQKGKVIAVGEGKYAEKGEFLVPIRVGVGQIVYYEKWSGQEIPFSGKEYIVISQEKILVVEK